jgi:hypothetical protein
MSDPRPADHDRRMLAAQRRAVWHLGNASWAGVLLAAYWDPEADTEALKHEMGISSDG